MTKLNELTIAEARDGLTAGDLTSVELTQASIDAMAATKDLNAFITETPDLALDRAKASDERRAASGAASGMDGIPSAMKDRFCTDGVQTTAGSHILEGFVPPYESTVSGKLKDAGAVMLGKAKSLVRARGYSRGGVPKKRPSGEVRHHVHLQKTLRTSHRHRQRYPAPRTSPRPRLRTAHKWSGLSSR